MRGINRRESLFLLTAGAVGLAGGAGWAHAGTRNATLYHNGDILTMEGDQPAYAEALIEHHGRIVFVGSLRAAMAQAPDATRHDLQGRTLLPGFIDGHGHLYYAGLAGLMADVMPPPDGPAASFATLIEATRSWADSRRGQRFIDMCGWIVANGYDDAQLHEGRHPTADILDQISTELPVLAIHQSGHVGCLNSKGLAAMGYDRTTPDPAGGTIRRLPDGTPDGLVEETAHMKAAIRILSQMTPDMEREGLITAQNAYVEGGYTTAQEARAMPNMTETLARAAADGTFSIDVIAYPDIVANAAALHSAHHRTDHSYVGRYRIGGAKLSLDGSPQAKTAWLSKPYHLPPAGETADYRGYPAMPDAEAQKMVAKALTQGWQLQCHANGDAAIDQFLDAVDAVPGGSGQGAFMGKFRPVLIHGQTLRKDQIPRLVQHGILPSLFAAHCFYWGDHHRKSVLGAERAARISPCRDVVDAGLTLTSHHDAPVIRPNAMRVLDATVNRTTRSGFVLGADQRLTPYEGLRTLTAWAAYQCFEETTKGTLAAGKLADLVILSANPLKVTPSAIHRIQVVDVIKEGQSVRQI